MTNEEQRLIGNLTARIDGLADSLTHSRSELREDMRRIYEKLDFLAVEGCAKGKQHEKEITELKQRPTQAVSLGAAVASIIAAGAAIVSGILRH